MPLKQRFKKAANLILIIPFIMALSTVFVIGKELGNGVVSGKYVWFYLSIGLISVATVFAVFINRKSVRFSIQDLLITIFCFSGLAVTYEQNGSMTHKSVLLLLTLALYFYFRIYLVQSKWNIFLLTTFFMLTGFVEAVWGLKQLYGFSSSQHSLFKTTGSFFNPGPYAGYLAMIAPFAFYYTLNDYRVFKQNFKLIYIPFYVRWGVATLSLIGILVVLPATMSRASWIAAIVGCAVVGFCNLFKQKKLQEYIKKNRQKLIAIAVSITIFSIIGLIAMYHLKKDSADGRVLIWSVSKNIILHYPLGVGIGNFAGVYGDEQANYFSSQQRSAQEQLVAGNPEYAFNEYLQICIEFGVIPFLIFVVLITSAIHRGLKKRRYAPVGALISTLIFASMSYPFSILPFVISVVFLVVLCSFDGYKPIHFKIVSIKKIVALTALLFVTGMELYTSYPQYDAYKRWRKAKILNSVNLHQDAVKEYANLYPYLDHEIQFLFEYAQSLSKSEQYEESNRVLKKAMKISCDPMLYNIMGKNNQALKNYILAEHCFTKSTTIVPSRLYPYYLLAKLYSEMGAHEKVCDMAEIIHLKEAKVHSNAVNEMREEMKLMCEESKNKLYAIKMITN